MSVHTLGNTPIGDDITGVQGQKGDKGDTGDTGADGDSVTGPQGPAGNTGPQGAASTVPGPAGSNGSDGTTPTKGVDYFDGNFVEYQYAVNGSTTVPPSIVVSNLNPAGWSTTPPTLDVLEYMWMTTAVKAYDGMTLVSNWTTPIRFSAIASAGITGATGPAGAAGAAGADGTNGDPGPIGPSPVFRGVYSAGTEYFGDSHRVDIVQYPAFGSYYVVRTDCPGGSTTGHLPTDTDYWNPFGDTFDSIATGLLFANIAYIDNLGVRQFSGNEAAAGTLDGAVTTNTASSALTPNRDTIIKSGYPANCTITINSVARTLTWTTNATTSMNAFYTLYSGDFGVTIVNNSNGSIDAYANFNFSSAIDGSGSSVAPVTEYAAAVAQVDYVTLSGVGGSCTCYCNGAVGYVYYSLATISGVALNETAADFVINNVGAFATYNVALTSSSNVIILTATGAQIGSAFSPATESNNIPVTFNGGISIRENEIFEDKEDSDNGYIIINNRGYNGGTSRARYLYIGDGRGNDMVSFNGANRHIYITIPNLAGGMHNGYLYYDSGTLKIS